MIHYTKIKIKIILGGLASLIFVCPCFAQLRIMPNVNTSVHNPVVPLSVSGNSPSRVEMENFLGKKDIEKEKELFEGSKNASALSGVVKSGGSRVPLAGNASTINSVINLAIEGVHVKPEFNAEIIPWSLSSVVANKALTNQSSLDVSYSCANSQTSLCYDYRNHRSVYKPARQWMPEINGLRAENMSLNRGRLIFDYSFK